MAKTRLKIADLTEEEITKVKAMEESLDTLILALEPVRPFAKLTEEQMKRLQELEKEMGVVLIAYDSH